MPKDYETALLDQILEPVSACLTPEAARRLVDLRADERLQERIEELADKSTEGSLSADEREEYAAFVSANNILAVLQAKARKRLSQE